MSIYDKVGSAYDSMRSSIGVTDVLEQVEALGEAISVLDLGCGTGHPLAAAVSPVVTRYLGIDNSRPMLDVFAENAPDAELMQLDMTEVGQLSGKWDLVFSWGSICHLPVDYQKKTIASVCRILAPGGRFLFTSGEEKDECTGTVGEFTVRHYSMGRDAYVKFLSEQGMELIRAGYSEGDFFVYLFRKKRGQ